MTKAGQDLGHFSDDGRSYILRNPATPAPWYNVHFSDADRNVYYSLMSNLIDGPVFARNADGHKLTLTPDVHRTLYLRDANTGDVWSIPGYPVKCEVDNYECVYTMQDTTVRSDYRGIRASLRCFVPRGAMYEVWTVELENLGADERSIQIMPYVPIALASHPGGSTRHERCEFLAEINGQFAWTASPSKPSELYNAFMVSSHPVRASLGNWLHFFHGIYSLTDPDIADAWDPPHIPGHAYALCFFLRNRVDLPPGGRATVHYATGTSDAPQSVAPIADLLKDDSRIEALLQEVKDEYADLTSTLTIQTGRPKLDAIMNIWIKKQMRSYLAFKNAYRDNLQIDMAYSLVDADRAVDNALDVLSFQYLDGHVPHSCRPLNPTHYSDKPAWLLMAWPELIKETGDVSLLERPVPYLREDGRKTREGKPVWEHLIRTMRHLELDTGPHGINLMHHADWNDGLDSLSGAGESTLTSLFFCAGLQEMEALARRIGESRIADEARDIYERLAERINTVCWDGRWYNRGFAPDGRSLGSHEREEGKIFLNPQVWAVISGVADPDRAAAVLQQADEKLETDLGMKLVDPSFSRYDPDVGSMSANPPGIAENGVYLHASAFKLVADCLAGRPDAAWRLMNKLLPDAAQNPLAQSRGLPFAVTNSYRAAESLYGLAGSPWRTGTAGWVYRAMIEYILGIRRGYDGLSVAPCLPKQLSDVRVSRAFRGVTYDIHLDNHSGNGVHAKRIEVDGKAVKGNALPLEQGVEQYTVEVVL